MDYRSREAAEYRRLYDKAAWRGPKGRRAMQLQAEPLCRFCQDAGDVVAATVADHIQPHRGDPDLFWFGELQSLCLTHHNIAKQQIEVRGWHDLSDASGYPTSPDHPVNRKRS